jgi:hypothetical protein
MPYLTIQFQYQDYNHLNQQCQDHIAQINDINKELIKDSCIVDNPEEMCTNYTYEVKDFDKFWTHTKHHLFANGHEKDVNEQIKKYSVVIYQLEKSADDYIFLHHFDKNTPTEQIH